VLPEHQDLFRSIGGRKELDELILSDSYLVRLESLRDLIELYDREVAILDRKIHGQLKDDPRYRVIQQLNGIGPVIAAILLAEIGDVSRFRSPEALCSWAGLTPRHFESDLTVHRGPITKMGSPLVRWRSKKASPATRATPNSAPTSLASPSGAASTRPASAWPANCSPSSTTASATAKSARSPRPGEQPSRGLDADASNAVDSRSSISRSGAAGQLIASVQTVRLNRTM
jgi:hypothetical protein